jgi:predicted RNase H-like HicB family nuclease
MQEVHIERIANLHIAKLPEGVYLATSDAIQGLMVQGRTIQETIEIARGAAKKLLEAKQEREGEPSLPAAHDAFDYPLIVNA